STAFALGARNFAGALCHNQPPDHSGTNLETTPAARLGNGLLLGGSHEPFQPDRTAVLPVFRCASAAHDRGRDRLLPGSVHDRVLSSLLMADPRDAVRGLDGIL